MEPASSSSTLTYLIEAFVDGLDFAAAGSPLAACLIDRLHELFGGGSFERERRCRVRVGETSCPRRRCEGSSSYGWPPAVRRWTGGRREI